MAKCFRLSFLLNHLLQQHKNFPCGTDIMINTYSTLVATAMENTIVFFSIVFDLHHFTMIMAAQLGCMKLIYTNYITPLLQLVFQFLDWPSAISSYNAITRITPVSQTDYNLLVISMCLFVAFRCKS